MADYKKMYATLCGAIDDVSKKKKARITSVLLIVLVMLATTSMLKRGAARTIFAALRISLLRIAKSCVNNSTPDIGPGLAGNSYQCIIISFSF